MFECFKKKKPSRRRVVHNPPVIKTDYPSSYLDAALDITGKFEGSGYSNVTGNFDGQGISAGILQWNYGQGSLQSKILAPFIELHGSKALDDFFPEPISSTAYMSTRKAKSFAKRKMLKGKNLYSDWRKCWYAFLRDERTIEIQKKAAHSVASKAWGYATKYKMTSRRAFCWFFDIVTQNGSLKGIELPEDAVYLYGKYLKADGGKNYGIWSKAQPDEEAKKLFVWTCLRVTRNRWAADVISRKGTIAHLHGNVHGDIYDLRRSIG